MRETERSALHEQELVTVTHSPVRTAFYSVEGSLRKRCVICRAQTCAKSQLEEPNRQQG
jgi:hypothetical protein